MSHNLIVSHKLEGINYVQVYFFLRYRNDGTEMMNEVV